MIVLNKTLVTRDTKGKCRFVHIWTEWTENKYLIHRESGLIGGKKLTSPNLEITTGKVKRTIDEQCELEFNSAIKKYLDKGYKDITELGITELTVEQVDKVLPKIKTDQNGNLKPMLCKILDKTNEKLTNKKWLASFKLDGLRCFLFYRDGEIHTSSRGGGDYDIATTYIREDKFLKKLFEEDPTLILDGELYYHHPAWNLQKISGLGRKQVLEEDHKFLKFYCYDVVMDLPFIKRWEILQIIQKCLHTFNTADSSKLVIVDHVWVQGLDEIMKRHDIAVSEGYEGLVIRDPDKEYKCVARDDRMLKIKEMTEDSIKVLGYELGLRGVEDMCFVLETKEGKQFKAKPEGDRTVKEEYMDNIKDIIGRMMDVRYFHYSEDGIPILPVAVCPRYDL